MWILLPLLDVTARSSIEGRSEFNVMRTVIAQSDRSLSIKCRSKTTRSIVDGVKMILELMGNRQDRPQLDHGRFEHGRRAGDGKLILVDRSSAVFDRRSVGNLQGRS
jgi:hypothetical protein